MRAAARYFWILALLFAGVASARDLARVQPEDVGLSSRRLADIDRFYAEKVSKGEMAGIVILIARHGKIPTRMT